MAVTKQPISPAEEHLIDPTLGIAVVDVARVYGLANGWVILGLNSRLDLGLPDGFLGRLERNGYAGFVAGAPTTSK